MAFRILAVIGICAKKQGNAISLDCWHACHFLITCATCCRIKLSFFPRLFTGRRWYFALLVKSNLSCHVKEISVNWVIVRLATFMTLSDSQRTVYIRICFRAKADFLRFLPRWFVVPFLKAPMVSEAGKQGRHHRTLQENDRVTNSFLTTTADASETIGDFTSLL